MILEDYGDIIHRCFRCGYYKFTKDYSVVNCPSYNKFRMETYSPGGRMWLIRAMMQGEIKSTQNLAKILHTCTMCGNCVEECRFKFNEDIMDIITAGRIKLVEDGITPPTVRDFFKNIYTNGNPWKEPQRERGGWAKGTEMPLYSKGDEYLYYVGCIGSYDPRVQKMARAFGDVLLEAGVSFGILGQEEHCDGNEVYRMGEDGLFRYLAEKSIELFKGKGIKKIITLSPHAYNIMHNEYPNLGGEFEVLHYTQFLDKLISDKRFLIPEGPDINVTYHDPCFLGRWNKIYDEPRRVLSAIPGVNLLEMDNNRENAICCGGGGGNFYTDLIGSGDNSPSRIRARQAYATGADVLAVACPTCMTMFEDAIKAEDLDDKLILKDISEIIIDAYKLSKE